MPRNDWIENNVQAIFRRAGLYPEGHISSVLDLACGLSLKSQFVDADVRVGVDIYRPYLQKIDAAVPYVAVNADVRDVGRLFLPKSFDLVLLLDILEHLEKSDAIRLLQAAEDIARIAVIVETPQGWVPQDLDIWGLGGDEYQTHRSAWDVENLAARGYRVLLRDYRMSNVRRHTSIEVDPTIVLMDAIKRMDGQQGKAQT